MEADLSGETSVKSLPDRTESVTLIFTVVRTHNVAYRIINYVAP